MKEEEDLVEEKEGVKEEEMEGVKEEKEGAPKI